VPAGATACQGPLDVPTAFAAAEVRVEAPAGARLEVVRSAGRARLAAGAIAPARGGAAARTARLDRAVPAGERVDVCLSGRAALAVHGGPGGWAPASGLRVDGRPAGTDATVALLRAEPASLLALLPEQARRASLFRPGWVGPWTYAVLLAAVVLAVPALLAAALRRAAAGEPADA
jgi:hypothetical protein